jgi:hypothetical protein
MAKLPALIVPVTIDSSGVDRGINSVNNKLRRGTGRFGVGGGTGFGTGGGQSGLIIAGGGSGTDFGDILLGGAIASRLRTPTAQKPRFISGGGAVMRTANRLQSKMDKANKARANLESKIRTYGKTPSAAADLLDSQMEEYELQLMTSGYYRRQQQLGKAVRRGLRKKGIRDAVSDITTIGGRLSPIAAKAGLVGAGLAGLYKASQYNQTMGGMFGGISQFEGTKDYDIARYFRDKYAIQQKPSLAQSFWLGAGKGSWMEKGLNSFSSESERYARGSGAMLANPVAAVASGNNPFMAFGGIPAKAALMPFGPAAGFAFDIYNTYKRVFA